MYRYQNMSEVTLSVSGVGLVEAGKIIETDQVIENPNFKLVGEAAQEPASVIGIRVEQPNMVTDIAPINNESEDIQ